MSNRVLVLVPFLLFLLKFVYCEEDDLGLDSLQDDFSLAERQLPFIGASPNLKAIAAPSQDRDEFRINQLQESSTWKEHESSVWTQFFPHHNDKFLPPLSDPATEKILLMPCVPAKCNPSRFLPNFVRIIIEIIKIPWKVVELIKIIWVNISESITGKRKFDITMIFQIITQIKTLVINLDLPNISLLKFLRPGTFLHSWVQILRNIFSLPLNFVLKLIGIVLPKKDVDGLRVIAELVIEVLNRVIKVLLYVIEGKPSIVIIKEIAPIFNIFGIDSQLNDLLKWLDVPRNDKSDDLIQRPELSIQTLIQIIWKMIFQGRLPTWQNFFPVIVQWFNWLPSFTGLGSWTKWIYWIISKWTGKDSDFPTPTLLPPWPTQFPEDPYPPLPTPSWPPGLPDFPFPPKPTLWPWPTKLPPNPPMPTLPPMWPPRVPENPIAPLPPGKDIWSDNTWLRIVKEFTFPKWSISTDFNRDNKKDLAGPAGVMSGVFGRRGSTCWILQPISWMLQIFRTTSIGLLDSLDISLNVLNNSLRSIIRVLIPGLSPHFDIFTMVPRIVRMLFSNPSGFLRTITQLWLKFFGLSKPDDIVVLIHKTLPWVPTQLLYYIVPKIFGFFGSSSTTKQPGHAWTNLNWRKPNVWFAPTFPTPFDHKFVLPLKVSRSGDSFISGPAAEMGLPADIEPAHELRSAAQIGPIGVSEPKHDIFPWLKNNGSAYSSKKKTKDEKCNDESADAASSDQILNLNSPTINRS